MGGIDKTALKAELTSGSDTKAEAAALRLAGEGSEGLAILKELAAEPDPDVRWWATRALAEVDDSGVTVLLVGALHDSDPEVRKCGALALGSQADERAVPFLIQALDAQDRLLARLAGNALVAIAAAAVPELIEVMQTGSQVARLEAIRALCEIGDPRAIPAFFSTFEEDSALMEYWAAEGLERMEVGMVFFKP